MLKFYIDLYYFKKFKNYISFLLFFFSTLDDSYNADYGFAILPVISVFFFIYLNINLKNLKFEKSFYLVTLILFSFNFFIVLKNNYLIFNQIIHFLILILFIATIYQKQKSDSKFIIRMLEFTIILHIFFFCIQLSYYFITKEYLDFIKIISSYDSRYSASYQSPISIRFTGMYSEPGTFYSYLFSLFSIHFIMKKNFFLPIGFIFFFFFSIISHSTFGFILSLLICLFLFLSSEVKQNKSFYYFVILFFLFFFNFDSYFFHFTRIFYNVAEISNYNAVTTDTISSRLLILLNYFTNSNFFIYGVPNDEILIARGDNSTFFTALTLGGFFLFLPILICFFIAIKNHNFFLVLLIFLAKLSWSYFFFWFALLILVLKKIK
jgi:hypothetical protein